MWSSVMVEQSKALPLSNGSKLKSAAVFTNNEPNTGVFVDSSNKQAWNLIKHMMTLLDLQMPCFN